MEGSFDGNSLKVAELLFKNGFKEAYAIEGGLRGKDGWEVSPLSLSEICSFVRLYIYIYICSVLRYCMLIAVRPCVWAAVYLHSWFKLLRLFTRVVYYIYCGSNYITLSFE